MHGFNNFYISIIDYLNKKISILIYNNVMDMLRYKCGEGWGKIFSGLINFLTFYWIQETIFFVFVWVLEFSVLVRLQKYKQSFKVGKFL